MVLAKEDKKKLTDPFKEHQKDTGSASVQIALITERINQLSEHFKVHKKDFGSRRGLLSLVSKRKKLLKYLKINDAKKYKEILDKLGLRG